MGAFVGLRKYTGVGKDQLIYKRIVYQDGQRGEEERSYRELEAKVG